MESNQDIARGYVKGDKVLKESLWNNLTEKLNSSGPPTKDCSGWKKTWADWKVYVKNKLSHNRRENLKTGGGQYNKYVLSDVEESVARLSGIFRSVEGIVGARDVGESDLNLVLYDEDELDSMHSTSNSVRNNESNDNNATMSKRQLSATQPPDPKRKRLNTPTTSSNSANNTSNLNTLLVEENNHLNSIVKLMEEQRQELRSQNKNIEKLCNIFETYFNGRSLHDKETQKLLKEKNELEIKVLEVETLKFEIERRRSEHQ